jgi:hypothetical protein
MAITKAGTGPVTTPTTQAAAQPAPAAAPPRLTLFATDTFTPAKAAAAPAPAPTAAAAGADGGDDPQEIEDQIVGLAIDNLSKQMQAHLKDLIAESNEE